MRITVTSGEQQVQIAVKGKSGKKLRAAEAIAHRLLAATPDIKNDSTPFGFALSSDTEHAEPHTPRDHEAGQETP